MEAVTDPVDVRLAAMNLLARREHSLWELRRKLKSRFASETLLDEQLSRLAEQSLQSDRRFAESYVRQRIDRGFGPVRLREELRARGVSRADITLVMDALEIDWHSHAIRVLQNKFGDCSAADVKEQARRARFMQHRGFSTDHYRKREHD